MPIQMISGRLRGFTLIELMIVVAVIGLLAAIALPSYQDSVRKSRRADAKAALAQLAQFMERNYSIEQRYDKMHDSSNALVNMDTDHLPFKESPVDGATKYYDLSLSSIAQNTYTLQATPKGAQQNDRCATLSLTNAGVKATTSTTMSATDCW